MTDKKSKNLTDTEQKTSPVHEQPARDKVLAQEIPVKKEKAADAPKEIKAACVF